MRKFAEATALADTSENRARVQQQAEIIGAEIHAGTFDYFKWFPNGNRAAEYGRPADAPAAQQNRPKSDGITVRQYYNEWIERMCAPVVRAGGARFCRARLPLSFL